VANAPSDIVRTTLAVLLIGALIGVSLWVLKPFMLAMTWAAFIVISTWSLMLSLEKKLLQRRGLAAALMTGLFLLVFVLPVSLAIGAIIGNVDWIVNWTKSFGNLVTPKAPDWLEGLPYVGKRMASRWQELAAISSEELRSHLLPHAGTLLRWLVRQIGNLGSLLLHFLMTLVFAAAFYVKGEAIAGAVHSLARRIAGTRGEESLHLAAQAIRAVALGVVVSSIVLAAFSWVGLAAAGIPYAVLLAVCIFMLNLVQLGPVPVLLPAVFWLYWKGDPGWATVLLVWTLLAIALDRVIGPFLIKKSADVSLFIILPGVLGGLIAFGIVGIFIGPMVLAVACTLLTAWATEGDHEADHVESVSDIDG